MSHEADPSVKNMDKDIYNPQEGEDIFGENFNEARLTPEELSEFNKRVENVYETGFSNEAIEELNNERIVVLPQQDFFRSLKEKISSMSNKAMIGAITAGAGISLIAAACGKEGKVSPGATFVGLNTATPTEVVGSASSTPTIIDKTTPNPTNTASPTNTETSTPTSEATPTPDHDKLPYEIGWSQTFGNVTLAIQEEAMEERNVTNPQQGSTGTLKEPGIHEVLLNTVDFPDAESKMHQAVDYAMYQGWVTADVSRADVTFGQYQQDLKDGKDMSFTIKGFIGDSYVVDTAKDIITVDPRKPIEFVVVANEGTQLHPFDGNSYGFREAKGKLYVEMYDYHSFGLDGYAAKGQGHPLWYSFAASMNWALSLLSENSVQQTGSYNFSQHNATSSSNRWIILRNILVPSRTSTEWNSIFRVQ